MFSNEMTRAQVHRIRAITLSTLSAAAFALVACQAQAVEYSESNHLTVREQKFVGDECVAAFHRVPPFIASVQSYDDLRDLEFYRQHLGCTIKLIWIRQDEAAGKLNTKSGVAR